MGQVLVELWDLSDWSGLPTSNPNGGKPWLHSSGVICVGSYTPPDLSTKADLVAGKVPSSQLPSYVDDVVEYSSSAGFPVTGETGKIYVAQDTNRTYRWSGSAYIELTDQTAVWGSISGTLSNQTDLNSALAAKANDSAVVHNTGNETIAGNKSLSGTTFLAVVRPIGSGLLEVQNIYGGTIASFGVGNGSNLFFANGAEFGWSDAKVVRNATGPTVQLQSDGGLAVKNAAGNAGGPISAGASTLSGTASIDVASNQTWATLKYAGSEFVRLGQLNGGYGIGGGAVYALPGSVNFSSGTSALMGSTQVTVGTQSASFTIFNHQNNSTPHLSIKSVGFTTKPSLAIESTPGQTADCIQVFSDAGATKKAGISPDGTVSVYNSFVSGSSFERGKAAWVGNVFAIGVDYAGTNNYRATRLVCPLSVSSYYIGISENQGIDINWGGLGRIQCANAGVTLTGNVTTSAVLFLGVYTVGTLPSASANAYAECNVSDLSNSIWGDAAVGGGSLKGRLRSNGTNWTIVGI